MYSVAVKETHSKSSYETAAIGGTVAPVAEGAAGSCAL